MAKETEKRQFVEVRVNVIVFDGEDVLTASASFGGVYGDLNNWGGVDDKW